MTASLPVGRRHARRRVRAAPALLLRHPARWARPRTSPGRGSSCRSAAGRSCALGHRYTRAIARDHGGRPGPRVLLRPRALHVQRDARPPRAWTLGRAAVRPRARPASAGTASTRQQQAGFFDYDTRTLRAGLGYDMGSDLRATVSYAYERHPALARTGPSSRSTAHGVIGTLAGTDRGRSPPARSTVGFRHQTNPLATGESASFDGFTLGGSLRRELGHSSSRRAAVQPRDATLGPTTRTPTTSNNSVVAVAQRARAVRGLGCAASVGCLRNDYPNDAPGARRAPPRRHPRLERRASGGSSAGAACVRADYRRERRDSNVPGYDVTTDGFVVQLGAGPLRPGAAPPMIATAGSSLAPAAGAARRRSPPTPAPPDPAAPPATPPRPATDGRLRGRPRRRPRDRRLRQRRPLAHPHRADERRHLAAAPRRGAGGRAHRRRGAAQDHEPPGEGLPREPAGRGEGPRVPEPVRLGGGRGEQPRPQAHPRAHAPHRRAHRVGRLQGRPPPAR